VLQILKVSGIEEIFFHEQKWRLDLTLGFRAPWTTSDGPALIVRDEGDESGIEDRTLRLPAQDHRLFTIVEALAGQAAKILEGVPVTTDERVEIAMEGKIDIVPSRKGQDVRETEDGSLASLLEVDGIGAPVHLPLDSAIRLETNDGVPFGPPAHGSQAPPKD